ncbi:MAG TPA: potassium channel family protein [Pseudonocardia sp.]|nr:potassium channel family protein [Pseudonocardia sp.]
MTLLAPALGVVLLLAVLQDIFATVLFPASGRGLIRKPLERAGWAMFRGMGRWVGARRRRNLVTYGGPTLIVLTLVAWFGLLIAGWSMIYAPAVGDEIVAASGPTDTSWTTAVYYSGFALTTLGTGDVVATSGGYRLLTVAEAAVGFTTFSMVVTYFLSVYSNLPSRNAFAQGLHRRTRGTDDAAVLLASLADGDALPATDFLSSAAASLRQIYQSHRSYPVLRYFHYREPEYALPRMLLTALDTAALIRAVLDPQHHARLLRSTALDEFEHAAESLLDELVPPGDRTGRRDAGDAVHWRERARVAGERLADAGLHLRPDPRAAADRYADLRAGWDPRLRALAAAVLYDWDDADGTTRTDRRRVARWRPRP